MASVHKTKRSQFWFCAYRLPDGTRTLRSTRTKNKKIAQAVCDGWAELAKAQREQKDRDIVEKEVRPYRTK